MAIAGKVAITPKGEWVNSTTYDKLDLVTYNGSAFVSKKSSTGETPVDGDMWMLLVSDSSNAIADIISGTTTVGNSSKLNGLPASSYLRNTTKYASSSTVGGGAIKLEYETIFEGATSSNIEDSGLTTDVCDAYGVVGINGHFLMADGSRKNVFAIFPMSDFYEYNDGAQGCNLYSGSNSGTVRFNDNDEIIEVSGITVNNIVFYNQGAFY